MKTLIFLTLFSFSALAGSSLQISIPYGTYTNKESGPELQLYYPDRTPAADVKVNPPPTVEKTPLEYRPQDYWQQPSSTLEYWGR